MADLLAEALGPGREGSLVRALCQEFLRGTLEGPDPPDDFADLVRILEAPPGGRSGESASLLCAARSIALARPSMRLADFARGYRERRGPARP